VSDQEPRRPDEHPSGIDYESPHGPHAAIVPSITSGSDRGVGDVCRRQDPF
jgi:hypothetical protein